MFEVFVRKTTSGIITSLVNALETEHSLSGSHNALRLQHFQFHQYEFDMKRGIFLRVTHMCTKTQCSVKFTELKGVNIDSRKTSTATTAGPPDVT